MEEPVPRGSKKKRRKKKKGVSEGGSATSNDVRANLITNVATAAGVDWNNEPIPPRMLELQRRHDQMVAIHDRGELSLHDFWNHNDFLASLTKEIHAEGERMKRAYLGASAQALRWANKGSKRAAQYETKMRSIRSRERTYNNEVKMAQFEVNWMKKSPAWNKAMGFLDEHWIKTKNGYVSKYDLKKDEEVTFDDMVAQMKHEDGTEAPVAQNETATHAQQNDAEDSGAEERCHYGGGKHVGEEGGGMISFEDLLAQMKNEELGPGSLDLSVGSTALANEVEEQQNCDRNVRDTHQQGTNGDTDTSESQLTIEAHVAKQEMEKEDWEGEEGIAVLQTQNGTEREEQSGLPRELGDANEQTTGRGGCKKVEQKDSFLSTHGADAADAAMTLRAAVGAHGEGERAVDAASASLSGRAPPSFGGPACLRTCAMCGTGCPAESDGSSEALHAVPRDTAAVDFSIDCARAVAGGVGRRHKPCSRCKVAFYCGKECQSRHWKEHKLRCTWPPPELEVDPEANRYPAIEGHFAGAIFPALPTAVTRIAFLQRTGIHVKQSGVAFYVSEIEEISMATAKGVCIGDEIVEVNGTSVNGMDLGTLRSHVERVGLPLVLGLSRSGMNYVAAYAHSRTYLQDTERADDFWLSRLLGFEISKNRFIRNLPKSLLKMFEMYVSYKIVETFLLWIWSFLNRPA